jgi:hypothetical protein
MRKLILPIVLMTVAFTQAADVVVNGNINAIMRPIGQRF